MLRQPLVQVARRRLIAAPLPPAPPAPRPAEAAQAAQMAAPEPRDG